MSADLEGLALNWTNGRRAAATLAGSLLAALAIAAPASAATYTPDTFTDTGDTTPDHCKAPVEGETCSLREAVRLANNTGADDLVELTAGTYELTPQKDSIDVNRKAGEPGSGKLIVRGQGARSTIIDANGELDESESRIFTFRPGSDGELHDLSLTGGTNEFREGRDDSDGGAIAVQDNDYGGGDDARALLTRVRLFANQAEGDGGAIKNRGKLTIVQSLIDGNTAYQSGGGIENDDELTLTNSTVSGNKALGEELDEEEEEDLFFLSEQNEDGDGNGGGIDNDGDSRDDEVASFQGDPIPAEAPFLRAESSTIAFNRAAGNGGGVFTTVPARRAASQGDTGGPIARFHNTIVSDNETKLTDDEPNQAERNCAGNQSAGSGAWTSSEGHNLEDGDSCRFTAAGDLNKASKLGELTDNGGGTNTHALAADSAAVNAAESDGCPGVDQRGTSRPQGGACDIGAFERVPDPAPEQQPQQQPQSPQGQPEQTRDPRCLDTVPPITSLKRDGLKVGKDEVRLRGTSRDLREPCVSGVHRVEVSLARVSGTDLNCRFLRRSSRFLLSPFMNCRESIRFVAHGTNRWTFRFDVKLPPGQYRVQARAYDEERNKETPKKRRNIVPFTVK